MPSVKRRASQILNEYGEAQAESGKVILTELRAPRACYFQINPIRMERALAGPKSARTGRHAIHCRRLMDPLN